MKLSINLKNLTRKAAVMAVLTLGNSSLWAQFPGSPRDPVQQARQQRKLDELRKALGNTEAYADEIVRRWDTAARGSGKWDPNYSTDLRRALMKLQPENLVAAGEATSYEAMLKVLQVGPPSNALPRAIGDSVDDLVYTPLTPCRLADTRVKGGPIAASTTRAFDADGSDFTSQGGSGGGCGVPLGAARAVALTITAVQPASTGFLTAFDTSQSQVPVAATMIYTPGVPALSTTTIAPIVSGPGNDFQIYSSQSTHVVLDVIGYFAAPVATPLDCSASSTGLTTIPAGSYTPVDAICPAGRTVTGGGYYVYEGSLGFPGLWIESYPNDNATWRVVVDNQTNGSRTVQAYAQCCRLPGR